MSLLSLLRHRLPRPLRAFLSRRSLPFWLLSALAATVTGVTVARAIDRAEAAADAAERRRVLVVSAPVAAGGRLDAGTTTFAWRPQGDLPLGALTERPPGAVAVTALVPGEVVVAARLAPAGLSPAAARLAPGTRGVAIPADARTLPVAVGDRVDVVALLPFDLAGPDGSATVVSGAATVVLVGDQSVVVAVPEADVPALARALAEGSVQLVLHGPG